MKLIHINPRTGGEIYFIKNEASFHQKAYGSNDKVFTIALIQAKLTSCLLMGLAIIFHPRAF
jgi:hypothetical protein